MYWTPAIHVHVLALCKSTWLIMIKITIMMLHVHVDTVRYLNRVIPYHFNQRLDMTLADLDEIWYTCSVCGHKKSYAFLRSHVIWLPKQEPLKLLHFFRFRSAL